MSTPAEYLAECAAAARAHGVARARVRVGEVEIEFVLGPLPGAAPALPGEPPPPDQLEQLASEWDRRARGER